MESTITDMTITKNNNGTFDFDIIMIENENGTISHTTSIVRGTINVVTVNNIDIDSFYIIEE